MSTAANSLEQAAVDEIGVRSGAVFGAEAEAQQLDLLRDPEGHLPTNIFQLSRSDPAKVRGVGRPKGSQNRASKDLAKLIAHKYGDPVEFMASLYAMPLDVLCETLLIADGTIARQQKLDDLLEGLAGQVEALALRFRARGAGDTEKDLERLADACEALESVARTRAGKPGDIAIKALNVQLAAAKSVSEYAHSKKPVEANINVKSDGLIVMPRAPGAGEFEQVDEETRRAAEGLAKLLKSGRIEADDIVGLQLVEGQFQRIEDAEFVPVDDDEAADDV